MLCDKLVLHLLSICKYKLTLNVYTHYIIIEV